jgi:hypothetical protein
MSVRDPGFFLVTLTIPLKYRDWFASLPTPRSSHVRDVVLAYHKLGPSPLRRTAGVVRQRAVSVLLNSPRHRRKPDLRGVGASFYLSARLPDVVREHIPRDCRSMADFIRRTLYAYYGMPEGVPPINP